MSQEKTNKKIAQKRKNNEASYVSKKYCKELEFVDCNAWSSGDEEDDTFEDISQDVLNSDCNFIGKSNHNNKNINDVTVVKSEFSSNLKSCDLPLKSSVSSEILNNYIENTIKSEYLKDSIHQDDMSEIGVNGDLNHDLLHDDTVNITTEKIINEDSSHDHLIEHTANLREEISDLSPDSEEHLACDTLAEFEIDEINYLPNIEDFHNDIKIEVEEHELQEEEEEKEPRIIFTQYKIKCENECESQGLIQMGDGGDDHPFPKGQNTLQVLPPTTCHSPKLQHRKSSPQKVRTGSTPGESISKQNKNVTRKKSHTTPTKQKPEEKSNFLHIMSALNQFESYNPFDKSEFKDNSICTTTIVKSNDKDTTNHIDESPQVMQCKECKQIKLSVDDCLQHSTRCEKIVTESCKSHKNIKNMKQILISKFQCPFCTSQFSTISSCRLHVSTTHTEENVTVDGISKRSINLLYCYRCCDFFHKKKLLTMNKKTSEVERASNSEASTSSNDVTIVGKYECPHCDKSLANLIEIRAHLHEHYVLSKIKKSKAEKNSKHELIENSFMFVLQFKCPACPAIFGSPSQVSEHKINIHADVPKFPKYYKFVKYVCNICAIPYYSEDQCLRHKKKCPRSGLVKNSENIATQISPTVSESGSRYLLRSSSNSILTTSNETVVPTASVISESNASSPESTLVKTNTKTNKNQSKPLPNEQDIDLPTSKTPTFGSSNNAKSTATSVQMRFRCPKCFHFYKSRFSCTNHLRKNHPSHLNLCDKIEPFPVYKCSKCKATCTSRQQYEFHISGCKVPTKDGITVRRYFCPRCKHHYPNLKLCHDHIRLNHSLHSNALVKEITSTVFNESDSTLGFLNKLATDVDESGDGDDDEEDEDIEVDVISDSDSVATSTQNKSHNSVQKNSVTYDENLKQDTKLLLRPVVVLERVQLS